MLRVAVFSLFAITIAGQATAAPSFPGVRAFRARRAFSKLLKQNPSLRAVHQRHREQTGATRRADRFGAAALLGTAGTVTTTLGLAAFSVPTPMMSTFTEPHVVVSKVALMLGAVLVTPKLFSGAVGAVKDHHRATKAAREATIAVARKRGLTLPAGL